MKELLFLCHRIPYPPNKGDKIRAYHWLEALAAHYRVHLGTFIDAAADWRQRRALETLVDQSCYRPLASGRAKLRSLRGLAVRRSLSMGYYRDRHMAAWVDEVFALRPIDAVFVFSSTMAPYVTGREGVPRVIDFVDVDSDKWRQYAAARSGPARWVYAREGKRLFAEERRIAAQFDASVFVSNAEAELFRRTAPETAPRVFAVGNGVDGAFFDPTRDDPDPYPAQAEPRIVFTGAMDYAANVDAVCAFVEHTWPAIRRHRADAQFWIVGARPARAVAALAATPGVQVTGTVDDVRPYLAHADVAVAPMRIARGIQNKVLEALAMGRPVVMSRHAATGLEHIDGDFARVVDDSDDFAAAVIACAARGARRAPLAEARNHVLEHYGWPRQVARLRALLECRPADGLGAVGGPA